MNRRAGYDVVVAAHSEDDVRSRMCSRVRTRRASPETPALGATRASTTKESRAALGRSRHRSRCRGEATIGALLAVLCVGQGTGVACDLHAVAALPPSVSARPGFGITVREQYTHFGTLQDGSDRVANPDDQFLDSSITHVGLGYDVGRRVGFRLTLPIISRTFRRIEAGGPEDGSESGIGDMSIFAVYRPYLRTTATSTIQLSLIGGLKLPTGDADRLGEEAEEHDEAGTAAAHGAPQGAAHGTTPVGHGGQPSHGGGDAHDASGIHGHDLALGSGSVDGILGANVFASRRRLFFTAGIQYALRTEGDFDYQYANDLVWETGPGVFLVANPTWSLGIQAYLTGETKGKDEIDDRAVDASLTALYLGPRMSFTWRDSLSADISGELPVRRNNTGLQIVPDHRVRAGITWHFGGPSD